MNEELRVQGDLERERFKQRLLAAHPENSAKILRMFKQDEQSAVDDPEDIYDRPESIDEPLEIEGLDITDIIEGITKGGGFLTEV